MVKRTKGYVKSRLSDTKLAAILLSPALLYILLIMMLPFAWAVYTSFTDKMIGKSGVFTGLKNYIEIFSDPVFLKSIWLTIVYTFISMAIKTFFGTSMALVLNKRLAGTNVFRAFMILPWTLPTVVVVLTWKWLFSDIGGAINHILLQTGIISEMIPWLSHRTYAMVSSVIVAAWRGAPFICISVLAGLQTLSRELYEAAEIDGANPFQQFVNITLPSVIDVLSLAVLVSTVWTINGFELVWLLTRGGPSDATLIVPIYSYTVGFRNHQIAKSIAVSVVTMPAILFLVGRITKKTLTE
jgi:multiple sugar transport system permease protein